MVVQLPALDLQVRQGQQPLARLQALLSTVFLHGLGGRGAEWDALQARVPAEAPDLRPYGPREDYVRDVVELIGGRRVALIRPSPRGPTTQPLGARPPD